VTILFSAGPMLFDFLYIYELVMLLIYRQDTSKWSLETDKEK